MYRILLLPVLIGVMSLLGCNDNALRQLGDPLQDPYGDPANDDDDSWDGQDDDDSGGPYDDGQPDDDDSDGPGPSDDDDAADEPPPQRIGECPPEAIPLTDFYGPDGQDEIYVLAWNNTQATATLVTPVAGLYDVYDTEVSESGASQTNESGYIRIANDHNPSGVPEWGNCVNDWIVPDVDNDGPPALPWVYLGTFDLNDGDNQVILSHYCPIFRAGECGTFHVGDPDAASGCNDSGPNSIHLNAEGICLIPRSP